MSSDTQEKTSSDLNGILKKNNTENSGITQMSANNTTQTKSNTTVLKENVEGAYRWKTDPKLTFIVTNAKNLVDLRKMIDAFDAKKLNSDMADKPNIIKHAHCLKNMVETMLDIGTNDSFDLVKNFMEQNKPVFATDKIYVGIGQIGLSQEDRTRITVAMSQLIAVVYNYTTLLNPNYEILEKLTRSTEFATYCCYSSWTRQTTPFKF